MVRGFYHQICCILDSQSPDKCPKSSYCKRNAFISAGLYGQCCAPKAPSVKTTSSIPSSNLSPPSRPACLLQIHLIGVILKPSINVFFLTESYPDLSEMRDLQAVPTFRVLLGLPSWWQGRMFPSYKFYVPHTKSLLWFLYLLKNDADGLPSSSSFPVTAAPRGSRPMGAKRAEPQHWDRAPLVPLKEMGSHQEAEKQAPCPFS